MTGVVSVMSFVTLRLCALVTNRGWAWDGECVECVCEQCGVHPPLPMAEVYGCVSDVVCLCGAQLCATLDVGLPPYLEATLSLWDCAVAPCVRVLVPCCVCVCVCVVLSGCVYLQSFFCDSGYVFDLVLKHELLREAI